jgi:hypothetical protein
MLQYERSNAQVLRSHAEFILAIRRIRNELLQELLPSQLAF